tara:strand:+ start:274 stop:639 length:366 start_codon:yes stop_codon:yes gene_type:complete
MTQQEITTRYLTVDQKHIKPCTIKSKDLLYEILKWWKMLTTSETIGDLDNMNGNTPLIKVIRGNNSYFINADSKKTGVTTFLTNKDNAWHLIVNERGVRNRITNNSSGIPISGLYIYKKIR